MQNSDDFDGYSRPKLLSDLYQSLNQSVGETASDLDIQKKLMEQDIIGECGISPSSNGANPNRHYNTQQLKSLKGPTDPESSVEMELEPSKPCFSRLFACFPRKKKQSAPKRAGTLLNNMQQPSHITNPAQESDIPIVAPLKCSETSEKDSIIDRLTTQLRELETENRRLADLKCTPEPVNKSLEVAQLVEQLKQTVTEKDRELNTLQTGLKTTLLELDDTKRQLHKVSLTEEILLKNDQKLRDRLKTAEERNNDSHRLFEEEIQDQKSRFQSVHKQAIQLVEQFTTVIQQFIESHKDSSEIHSDLEYILNMMEITQLGEINELNDKLEKANSVNSELKMMNAMIIAEGLETCHRLWELHSRNLLTTNMAIKSAPENSSSNPQNSDTETDLPYPPFNDGMRFKENESPSSFSLVCPPKTHKSTFQLESVVLERNLPKKDSLLK